MSRGKPKTLKADERAVLRQAMTKDQRGETLNKQELRIVEKAKKIGIAEKINELLPHFPAKVFFDAADDTPYKVKKFIDSVGVPIPKVPGELFDLREFFKWFYDFHRKQRFIPKSGDESLEYLDIRDRLFYEKYRREQIARLRDEKKYVPVDVVYEIMYRFTTTLRLTAERIGQQHGDDIFEAINDAVDEARETITEIFYFENENGTEAQTSLADDGDDDNE